MSRRKLEPPENWRLLLSVEETAVVNTSIHLERGRCSPSSHSVVYDQLNVSFAPSRFPT